MTGELRIQKGRKLFGEQEICMLTDSTHIARDAYLSLKDKIKERGYFLGKADAQRQANGTYAIHAGIFDCRDSRQRVYELEAIFTPTDVQRKSAFDSLFID